MRILRIKAYLFDFLILALVLCLINLAVPKGENYKTLKNEQDAVMEDYLSGQIDFKEYVQNYGELYYQSSLEEQIPYLLYLLFMLGYFVVLPFLWKGRTVGCYLCNVQVERFDQGVLHPWQLLVRYSFTFGLGYVLLNNILLLVLSSRSYFITISIVAIFQFVLAIFSGMTVLLQKEKRGLHELVSNTELTRIIDQKRIQELEKENEKK